MLRWGALWGCCIVAHLLLVGCGALRPPQPHETVRPQTPPVRNITSFTESLRCMDELLVTYRLGGRRSDALYVTSDGVIDNTGKGIGGANRDVVTSTISRMATRSGAYTFVRYNPRKPEELGIIQAIYGDGAANFNWPRYEISGGITQLDENVDVRTLGISLALPYGDLGASKDWQATIVSVDVNVYELPSGQLLNGMTASNSMAIVRRGKALDGGAVIKKVGVFFNLSLDKNEGLYAAVRALIELSLIEVLGKLAKAPYWQCLQMDHTNPEVLKMTADWYETMHAAERVRFVQRVLARHGYYRGAVTGTLDSATQDAIARYQAATDLILSGRIDLALYRQLISRDLPERLRQAQDGMRSATAPAVELPAVFSPMHYQTQRVQTGRGHPRP
jgi:Putative peptidoglycan binding domain